MDCIAEDGRKGWSGIQPLNGSTRDCRARICKVLFKKIGSKEFVELTAECYKNVETFFLLCFASLKRTTANLKMFFVSSISMRLLWMVTRESFNVLSLQLEIDVLEKEGLSIHMW